MGARAWFPGSVAIGLAIVAAVWGSRSGIAQHESSTDIRNYAAEAARLEQSAASLRGRALSAPRSWMALEQLAAAHVELARLSGGWHHYAAAESLIERAFEVAPEGSGPFMSRARLNFTLHRLNRVEADLAAIERQVVLDEPTRAAIAGLRADVAFQRGRFDEARTGYESALALHADMSAVARLAQHDWKTGNMMGGAAGYLRSLTLYHGASPLPVAWTHLQLGLMDLDAGRLEEALVHYEDGAAAFPGWWLIDEHIAEIHALRGRTAEAESRYRDLIVRTGDPEFMDALATICAASGRESESRAWVARAEQIHLERLACFPEAAYGHALGHFLEFGTDPAFSLDLAERNHALRPNPEARALLDRAIVRTSEGLRASARPMIVTSSSTNDAAAAAPSAAAARRDQDGISSAQ